MDTVSRLIAHFEGVLGRDGGQVWTYRPSTKWDAPFTVTRIDPSYRKRMLRDIRKGRYPR